MQPASLKPKVLVLDHEPLLADLLKAILIQSGFDAVSAYSDQEVVSIAHFWSPDVFLADISRRELAGIHLAVCVRTMRHECKVILFSSEASAKELAGHYRAQGHEFEIAVPPIEPEVLIHRLEQLTRRVGGPAKEPQSLESRHLQAETMQAGVELVQSAVKLAMSFCSLVETMMRSGPLSAEEGSGQLGATIESLRERVGECRAPLERCPPELQEEFEALETRLEALQENLA